MTYVRQQNEGEDQERDQAKDVHVPDHTAPTALPT
jgi:hypothetical protein